MAHGVVARVAAETVRAGRQPKSGTRRRLERLLADAAVRVALLVFVIWTLAPVAWMIVSSLLNQVALTSVPPDLSPGQFTLDNYRGVLATGGSLVPALKNSLVVSLLTAAISLTLGSAAAYALARLSRARREHDPALSLATQMFPGIVIAIPLFIVFFRPAADRHLRRARRSPTSRSPRRDLDPQGLLRVDPSPARASGRSRWREHAPDVPSHRAADLAAGPLRRRHLRLHRGWNEFFFAIILTRVMTRRCRSRSPSSPGSTRPSTARCSPQPCWPACPSCCSPSSSAASS